MYQETDNKVRDLRSALKLLESMPGQLIEQNFPAFTAMWEQEEQ